MKEKELNRKEKNIAPDVACVKRLKVFNMWIIMDFLIQCP